jgi:hypothetical protein
MDFESANPTVVKSIKQRDLLNTWLRLYARDQKPPAVAEYQPTRIEEELPDLVFFSVDATQKPPHIIIDSDGTRMASAMAIPARAGGWRNISACASRLS